MRWACGCSRAARRWPGACWRACAISGATVGRRSAPRASDQLRSELMKKPRLVVVGNGMAGARTLEELLKLVPDMYDITVFGAEPHPNYNRILLSPVLAGEQTIDEIILHPLSWYAEHGIPLPTRKKGTAVHRQGRIV